MPAWVTPPDFTAGQVHTAAHHDDIATDLTYLYNVNHLGSNQVVPPNVWTTTSSSLVDWNDDPLLTVTYAKRGGTETSLRCDIHTQGYVTGGAALVQFGIYNGVQNYQTSIPHYFNTVNVHQHVSETLIIPSLTAATYTLKLRVAVSANTFVINQDDFAQLIVTEVIVG